MFEAKSALKSRFTQCPLQKESIDKHIASVVDQVFKQMVQFCMPKFMANNGQNLFFITLVSLDQGCTQTYTTQGGVRLSMHVFLIIFFHINLVFVEFHSFTNVYNLFMQSGMVFRKWFIFGSKWLNQAWIYIHYDKLYCKCAKKEAYQKVVTRVFNDFNYECSHRHNYQNVLDENHQAADEKFDRARFRESI